MQGADSEVVEWTLIHLLHKILGPFQEGIQVKKV
jgi:hypothetical protein